MSKADKRPPVNVDVMLERESLAESIESILSGEAGAADALAGLFVEFKQAIDGGLKGINRAREALLEAVELAYLHSRAHEAALRLNVLSQEGQLKVADEPVRLIEAAIERSGTAGARG
ncbi:MAG TPA: hypothetical protein VNA19_08355 [Pyrinomonadaceae bacterium]|jgi:hypothetical protein|nr:hypothetical protein [Pyrinomonadaceae bacterium]